MGPLSKFGTGKWFHDTFLELRWTPKYDLSCQKFLNNMGYHTPDVMRSIEEGFAKRLIERGVDLTTLVWDTTNFSTYRGQGRRWPLRYTGTPRTRGSIGTS